MSWSNAAASAGLIASTGTAQQARGGTTLGVSLEWVERISAIIGPSTIAQIAAAWNKSSNKGRIIDCIPTQFTGPPNWSVKMGVLTKPNNAWPSMIPFLT